MTADPRATARAWLVDVLHAAECGCGDYDDLADDDVYARHADAILSAPGVEVCALTTSARLSPTGTLVIGPDVEERAAILLPAEVRPAWIKDGQAP